jgi:hypothetical protein
VHRNSSFSSYSSYVVGGVGEKKLLLLLLLPLLKKRYKLRRHCGTIVKALLSTTG